MQKSGMPLLVHGEVTHADVDIFDREAVFIDEVFKGIIVEAQAQIQTNLARDSIMFVSGQSECCLLYTSPSPRDS